MHVVWFKRDLRVEDHRPLVEASARGSVLCIFVVEPELWRSAEFDVRHHRFIMEGLRELEGALARRGGTLSILSGEMVETLARIHAERPITALYSHEETGNAITYDRDRRVKAWCEATGVPWREYRQHGVVRRLGTRNGWAARWARFMADAPLPAPGRIEGVALTEALRSRIPEPADFGFPKVQPDGRFQPGGESLAHRCLEGFITERGENYRRDMSSPLHGWEGCSRLSPYLAWGNLSVRQAYHRARDRAEELRALRRDGVLGKSLWAQSIRSFQSRLRWHCHFMQKLEDEPEIEFRNIHRGFDGMRENDFHDGHFEAWRTGHTGYPLVDACMRALHQTGWVNFRMRAMLMSFASYHLWLHWRPTALHLGGLFLDFEPGIHFSQAQMQSGVTGINAIRVYSPTKQAKDNDPEGRFIRRFVPELEGVPTEHIAEPHRMGVDEQRRYGCLVGTDYPAPVVDHATAYREARARVFRWRRQPHMREESQRVYEKHGSRKSSERRRGNPSTGEPRSGKQLSLDMEGP